MSRTTESIFYQPLTQSGSNEIAAFWISWVHMYYLVASRLKIRGIDVCKAICVPRFMKEADPAGWGPQRGFLTCPGLCMNRTFACGGEE